MPVRSAELRLGRGSTFVLTAKIISILPVRSASRRLRRPINSARTALVSSSAPSHLPRRRSVRPKPCSDALADLGPLAYDCSLVSEMDSDKERERLRALYGGMEDGELNKIASDLHTLTDVARETLRAEISRRGLELPPELAALALRAKEQSELPEPELLRRYRDLRSE